MPQANLDAVSSQTVSPPASLLGRCRVALAEGTVVRAILNGFLTVASLTLLSKAVSFIKDAGVAHRYGIIDELDAFNVAFGVFNFAACLLGSGLPAALMPAYSRMMHLRGSWRAERLAAQSAMIHFAFLLIVSLAIWLCSTPLTWLLCGGFTAIKQQITMHCLVHLIPFFVFYGLTLHLSTWLRGQMEFAIAAVAPVLTPLTILAVIYAMPQNAAADVLVDGTNLGSALTLAALLWHLRTKLPMQRRWWLHVVRLWEPAHRGILIGAGPFIIAGALIGSAPLIDQAMATPLTSGSVTALSYSEKVCSIILALTATAAADTLFPFFSQRVARCDWPGLRRQLIQTTMVILVIAVPMVSMLCWQAPLIVRLLFERGHFTPQDTENVAHVLRFAALQIPFYIASLLMSRVVVSLQANSFTLVVTSIALVNNVVFNKLLMGPYGAAGIALSTAIVYLASCVVLYVFLFRRIRQLAATASPKEAANGR